MAKKIAITKREIQGLTKSLIVKALIKNQVPMTAKDLMDAVFPFKKQSYNKKKNLNVEKKERINSNYNITIPVETLAQNNMLKPIKSLKSFKNKHLTPLRDMKFLKKEQQVYSLKEDWLSLDYMSRFLQQVLNNTIERLDLLEFQERPPLLLSAIYNNQTLLSLNDKMSLWNQHIYEIKATHHTISVPDYKSIEDMPVEVFSSAFLDRIIHFKTIDSRDGTALKDLAQCLRTAEKYKRNHSLSRNQVGVLDFLIRTSESLIIYNTTDSYIYKQKTKNDKNRIDDLNHQKEADDIWDEEEEAKF